MKSGLTRAWGDGGGDTRSHVVEDISFTLGFITCRCGRRLVGADPSELGLAWQRHGGTLLDTRDFVDRGEDTLVAPSQERAEGALADLLDVIRSCSCPDSLVTGCPNYQPGDEADDAFTRDEDDDSD